MRRTTVALGALLAGLVALVAPAQRASASGTVINVSGRGSDILVSWDVELTQWHLGDLGLGLGVVSANATWSGMYATYRKACLLPIAFDIRVARQRPYRVVSFKCIVIETVTPFDALGGPPVVKLDLGAELYVMEGPEPWQGAFSWESGSSGVSAKDIRFVTT